MRSRLSNWPDWAIALCIAVVGGVLILAVDFILPELGWDGVPSWVRDPDVLIPALVVLTALLYAGLTGDEPRKSRRPPRWHLAIAGLAAGLSIAYFLHRVLETPITAESLLVGAVAGVGLGLTGVVGWLARLL